MSAAEGQRVALRGVRVDEASFEEVLVALYGDVHRMVAHQLGPGASEADVEDITQLVFEAAYKAWPKFRGEARVSTWLYGIAFRVVLKQLRSWRRHRRLLQAVVELPRIEVDPTTPEQSAQHRQEAMLVWRCLMRIKPKKRVVYVMHDIEGRSAKEIAEIMKTSKSTIWSRLRHARQELAAHLQRARSQEVEP